MERKEYSAGAVKLSFWFMEFRKVVSLLNEGKWLEDIKQLNKAENIFGAPTKVLTSIRTHGASSKHLSESESSTLAMFKEPAMEFMDDSDGTIVPFQAFYDALENFLDHSRRSVILKAYENSFINPDGKEAGVFVIDVLKGSLPDLFRYRFRQAPDLLAL